MSSYWSKRRKVVSSVQDHVDAIYISAHTSSCETQTDYLSLGSQSPLLPECPDTECCAPVELCNLPESPTNVHEDVAIVEDEMAACPLVFDDIDFDFSGNLSDDSGGSDFPDIDLATLLVAWVSKYNISHLALDALLCILREYHTYLPKDARTLLKTATQYNVVNIAGGCYYHFGIENWVKSVVSSLDVCTGNVVEVSIQANIDGLPLFKSSGAEFWPILGRLVKPETSKPFVIGLYSGNQKPTNVFDYLDQFVTELAYLFQNGVLISDAAADRVPFSLSCIICDAPAKAFVKQVKGHSWYYSCDKCVQRGHWQNKVTFPETNARLRTDVSFDEMQDEDHHVGPSPFRNLPFGMVSQFPIDAMHLVYLGVMKRMLWLWMKGPIVNACRIGGNAVRGISEDLLALKKFMPREFNRKARSLDHVGRWKASEFRQFLLYTGPVVLHKHLSSIMYKHFMLLFISIFCLSCDHFCESYREYSHELLCRFVQQFGELYGTDQLVFNVHGLIHLAGDVQKFGPLDNFTAFVFESFLGNLKRLVRKPTLPLQQVIRRISESKGNIFDPTACVVSNKEGILKKKHVNGPVPRTINHLLNSQFKEIHFSDIYISTSKGDNCILIHDDVAIVRNIITVNDDPERRIVYERFANMDNCFRSPLPSSDLRIWKVSQLRGTLHVASFSEICCKCVLLPFNNNFVCIPLVHNFDNMFLVVEFEETSEVAVVSASWLANDQLSVLWPPYKSSKKVDAAIQAHEVPEDHWSSWTVKRTMYRTDNFVKAVRKSRIAEDESDLQTDGEQPSLQKRKKRPNPRFMDSESDSESHDEGDVLPPPPPKVSHLMPRPSSVPTQPQSSSGRLDLPTPPALSRSSLSSPPPSVMCAQSPSLQLALPPPSALSRSSFSSPPPSVMRAQSSSFRLDLPPPSALSRSSFSSPPPYVMRTHSPSSIRRDLSSPPIYARPAPSSTHSTRPHTSSTPPPSTQRLSSLTPPSSTVIPERDIRFFRVMEEIREEVKETKAMVASIAQQMRADVRDSPLPEGISLPLCFEEELRAVEERLEDPTILKMMVAHLSSIGGANVKAMTRRIMKAAFRNQLAVAYNWTGAKDKLTFGTLMLTTAILRAVRRIFPASSTSEVEVHLKDWLRNAKDRDGGRKNRMRTPPAASVSDDET